MTSISEALAKYYNTDDPNNVLDWDVWDEYIVVTGATGTGKSKLVENEIISKLQGVPLWILDPKKRFSDCGIIVNSVDELKTDKQYVLQPKDLGIEMFGKFCLKLQKEFDLHGIIDEIHLWLSKQSLFRPHYDLVMSKRNDGVTTTSISTDTKAIPNYLLKNITHVYSLRYNLPSDVEWLGQYIGEKAQFLLPPDKREPTRTGFKKDGAINEEITFKDLPMMKKYSFIYRDQRKMDAGIIGGFEDVT